jgi:hypothetical protein
MNSIIELNQQAIDLRNLKSAELHGNPIAREDEHELRLRFLKGKELLFNEVTGKHEWVESELHIPYPDYSKAARAHSVLKRAWGRYRDEEERINLLKAVERELGLS